MGVSFKALLKTSQRIRRRAPKCSFSEKSVVHEGIQIFLFVKCLAVPSGSKVGVIEDGPHALAYILRYCTQK